MAGCSHRPPLKVPPGAFNCCPARYPHQATRLTARCTGGTLPKSSRAVDGRVPRQPHWGGAVPRHSRWLNRRLLVTLLPLAARHRDINERIVAHIAVTRATRAASVLVAQHITRSRRPLLRVAMRLALLLLLLLLRSGGALVESSACRVHEAGLGCPTQVGGQDLGSQGVRESRCLGWELPKNGDLRTDTFVPGYPGGGG